MVTTSNNRVMRKINRIVWHCSATPEGRDVTVEEIDSWHRNKGYKCIGYHWVIYLDGSIHAGRPESQIGAHTKDFNSDSIGICYIGGCDKDMKPKDTRTEAQKEAMKKIYYAMNQKYGMVEHLGHRDFWTKYGSQAARKACPSFDVQTWIKEL